MSVFTNETTIQGRINKMYYHDGGENAVLYLTIGIKSGYTRGNTPKYESINAQINVKLNKEGKPTSVSNHPKSKMNLEVFNYLNNHAVKGMSIQLKGNLRGTDLAYVGKENKWKVLTDLTEDDRSDISAYKNETFLYIEHAQLLEKKEHFLERQKEGNKRTEETKILPKDRGEADYIPDNEDEEEGIEVIVEYPENINSKRKDEENAEEGEAIVIDRKNNPKEAIRKYVPFESTIYSEDIPDFPEPEINFYR